VSTIAVKRRFGGRCNSPSPALQRSGERRIVVSSPRGARGQQDRASEQFVVGAWLGPSSIAVIRNPPLYQVRAFILPARRSKEREASAYSTCSLAFLASSSRGRSKPMIEATVKRSCSSA
jgi:hypothetical protein